MNVARKLKNDRSQLAEPVQPLLELVPVATPTPDRPPEQLWIRTLEIVRDRVEQLHAQHAQLHAQQRIVVEGLRNIERSLPQQRRPLSRRAQSIHIEATLKRRNGICPCCQETPVCDDQGRLPTGEYDHWFSRNQNGAKQTWLICSTCNARLAVDTEFKNGCRSAFESYQQALRPLLSKQTQFALTDAGSAA